MPSTPTTGVQLSATASLQNQTQACWAIKTQMVSNSRSIKPTLKKSLKFRIEASFSPKRAANAALSLSAPTTGKKPRWGQILQWLDSTAFLMKETNKYGPDFCVCRLGRHNFSVPARHHAFTITSLARTSRTGSARMRRQSCKTDSKPPRKPCILRLIVLTRLHSHAAG